MLTRPQILLLTSLAFAAALGTSALSQPIPTAPTTPSPSQSSGIRSIQSFGVLPTNTPDLNKANLQSAIDWASTCGGELQVDPSDQPYRLASGLTLKQNASLVGVHGPVGRGTRSTTNPPHPVGSVFQIEDDKAPFITVESATQIRGIQFWYSQQTLTDPAKIIQYPPTIQVSQTKPVWGVTLSSLTFYGEFIAMDFNANAKFACEQILFEHCYGYPLSGEFIRIDRCYDVPRILHCHVNPANMRAFAGDFRRPVIDSVVARGAYTFSIDHTDNAVLMDLFTFGAFGGAKLGAASYGQLTNFNFDCVSVGIFKDGDSTFNRNWQLAQGSIIANIGDKLEDIHPIIIQGQGHTAISNVEAFSGPNGAVTAKGQSQDFLLVRGDNRLTVSLSGCRMRNYAASSPITVENAKATVVMTGCFDKMEELCDGTIPPITKAR